MTEVLSAPQPDGHSPFGSPLQRSSPRSSYLFQNPPSYSRPAAYYNPRPNVVSYSARLPASEPSSAPSSPRLLAPEFSRQPSYISTPSSSFSFNDKDYEDYDSYFPAYDQCGFLNEANDPEPPSSPDVYQTTPPLQSPLYSSALSRSHYFNSETTTGDDMAMRTEPTRHVDYLSHKWNEEDIWASWRHVVARRNIYSNGKRLENASWRTWTQSKYHLHTLSPEILNWYKKSLPAAN